MHTIKANFFVSPCLMAALCYFMWVLGSFHLPCTYMTETARDLIKKLLTYSPVGLCCLLLSCHI